MNTKAVRIHGKMDLRLDDVQLPVDLAQMLDGVVMSCGTGQFFRAGCVVGEQMQMRVDDSHSGLL